MADAMVTFLAVPCRMLFPIFSKGLVDLSRKLGLAEPALKGGSSAQQCPRRVTPIPWMMPRDGRVEPDTGTTIAVVLIRHRTALSVANIGPSRSG